MAGRLVYHVNSRTLTALNQVADQYAGILINAELAVEPHFENNTKRVQVSKTNTPIASKLGLVKLTFF
jgi:hypothetical protein